MSHTINRRALLRGATAVSVGVGLATAAELATTPEVALAAADTPIARLYREWQAEKDFLDGPQGRPLGEEAFNERMDGLRAIEARIEAEEPTNLQDLAAKVGALTSFGDFDMPNSIALECGRILGRDASMMPRRLFGDEEDA